METTKKNGETTGRRTAGRLARARRDEEFVILTAQGYSTRQVAERLGIGKSSVHRAFAKALASAPKARVEEMRQLQSEQIRQATNALQDKVERGDVRAVEALVKLLERQSRLFGLDAPATAVLAVGPVGAADFASTAAGLLSRIAVAESRHASPAPDADGLVALTAPVLPVESGVDDEWPGPGTVGHQDDAVEQIPEREAETVIEVEAELVPAAPWTPPSPAIAVGNYYAGGSGPSLLGGRF